MGFFTMLLFTFGIPDSLKCMFRLATYVQRLSTWLLFSYLHFRYCC